MHDLVVNELEEHLAGTASMEFHAHLAACPACRTEVESIAQVSQLLAELRSDTETAPSPYFYTRVAASIVEHQNTDHWGLLAPGAAFFRRVAFASLVVLACLGSYLVMREGDVSGMSVTRGTDAAAVIAQHDVTDDHAASSDRNLMLVTLASYGE